MDVDRVMGWLEMQGLAVGSATVDATPTDQRGPTGPEPDSPAAADHQPAAVATDGNPPNPPDRPGSPVKATK